LVARKLLDAVVRLELVSRMWGSREEHAVNVAPPFTLEKMRCSSGEAPGDGGGQLHRCWRRVFVVGGLRLGIESHGGISEMRDD
jgi:hypothetical protein